MTWESANPRVDSPGTTTFRASIRRMPGDTSTTMSPSTTAAGAFTCGRVPQVNAPAAVVDGDIVVDVSPGIRLIDALNVVVPGLSTRGFADSHVMDVVVQN